MQCLFAEAHGTIVFVCRTSSGSAAEPCPEPAPTLALNLKALAPQASLLGTDDCFKSSSDWKQDTKTNWVQSDPRNFALGHSRGKEQERVVGVKSVRAS